MPSARAIAIWAALGFALGVPIALAAASPQLAWRDPVYITAGFAGIVALGLMLVQPLLIGGDLPGASAQRGRRVHRWIGAALLAAVVVHVGGLWIANPEDVVDALTFVSPTPFSAWGVIAMATVFTTALLAALRRRLRLRPRTWRFAHLSLAAVIVVGAAVHATLIEGTMETISKAALCVLVLAVTAWVTADVLVWRKQAASR
jgi:predicted ferric reductase